MGADASELRSLSVDFRTAGTKARSMASKAVRKTAFEVEARAKARAPIDTGALRNSIATTVTGELSAEIGPTVAYAAYVEYGHMAGGTLVAPQPYMAPAADSAMLDLELALEEIGGDL